MLSVTDGGKCDTDAADRDEHPDIRHGEAEHRGRLGGWLHRAEDHRYARESSPGITYQSVNVTTLPQPASLTAKAASTTISATADSTEITGEKQSRAIRASAMGMNDQLQTFVTTGGTLTS